MGGQDEEFPAQWALDLLRGPTIYKEVFYTKYVLEISCTIAGAVAMPCKNYFLSRPLYSSLPLHAVCIAMGFAIGRAATYFGNYRYAKRDAMMVDYIKLHPERFPAPRNKKFGEIIEPWYPMR